MSLMNFAKKAQNLAADGAELATGLRDQAMEKVGDTLTFEFADIGIEINTAESVDLLYDLLIPKTAQAALRGEMPTRDDFQEDAIALVGGPIEGIYVAATSETARQIANGETPETGQVAKDMIEALTPIGKRRLGL